MVFTKLVSLVFICFFLTSFTTSKHKNREFNTHIVQIRKKFIREMEKNYDCEWSGHGGSMLNNIEYISVSFDVNHRATIEEARAMEVLAIERFAEMLNTDEKIRPYLCEYPFPPHRIEIKFNFYAPYRAPYADGNLMYLSQIRGKLFYSAKDPTTGHFVSLLKEPYEEAKKIVDASPIQNPFIHQEKPHEPLIDAIFTRYLNEVFKKYDLECEIIGGKLTDCVDEVVVRLICFRPTHIDKARELQVVATETMLEAINGNESLKPYVKDYPLSLDKLNVTVLFRKPNYFPYSSIKESLESVCQNGDEVTYFTETDEDFKKPLVYATESYRECVDKVRNSPRGKKLKMKW